MKTLATDAFDQGGKLLWARVDWPGRFRSYTSCFMWGVKQGLSGGSIADASEHGSSVGKTFFGVPGRTKTLASNMRRSEQVAPNHGTMQFTIKTSVDDY